MGLLSFFFGSAMAAGVATSFSSNQIEYVRNYDGDTFVVNIKSAEPVFGLEIPVRIRGVDTAEMRTKMDCERTEAAAAQGFLQRTLEKGRVELKNCERDKYFRLLCDVSADGKDVAKMLIDRKWAVPYDGGVKAAWRCAKPQ